MTACDWLRREGVGAEERGEVAVVTAHLEGCADCREDHAAIDRVRADLARLPAPAPQRDWQRQVWATIEKRRKPRWWRLALPIALPLAGAAAMAGLLLRTPAPPPETGVLLAVHFEPNPTRARTRGPGDAAVGDLVVLEAAGIDAPVAELRVYRDDAGLVFQCGAATPCQRQGGKLLARFQIPAIGHYRAFVLTARTPLPPASGTLDADLAAVARQPDARYRAADGFEIW